MPSPALNLSSVFAKSDDALTDNERHLLGLCYITAGEEETGLLYLRKAASNNHTDALIALGEYSLQTGQTEAGIRYLKQAALNRYFIYHHLGRHYLFNLNGVEQDDEKALKCFQSLGGHGFTTNDEQAPSTLFCIKQARTNLCMKRIQYVIEMGPELTTNEKSNALLTKLHDTLQLKLTSFQTAMRNIPLAKGKRIPAKSSGSDADFIYLDDSEGMFIKRDKALYNFKNECRNEINKTIKLLDKDDLRAVDYLLNLIKAIINVGVRVLNLCGLANKNSFFPYTHAEPAKQLLALNETLLEESFYKP